MEIECGSPPARLPTSEASARDRLEAGDLDAAEEDLPLEPKAARAPGMEAVDIGFVEVFAGVGGITFELTKLGVHTHPAVDYKTEPLDKPSRVQKVNVDLSSEAGFRKVLMMIREGRVRWMHLAPPCGTFSMARRWDKHGKVDRLRSKQCPGGIDPESPLVQEANDLMQKAARLARACIRAGAWFTLENPKSSYAWEHKPIASLRQLPGVRLLTCSQCMYGSEYKKDTKFLTNAPWMEDIMKTCPGQPGHPVHPQLAGHYYDRAGKKCWVTELAAEYPQALCQTMAEAYVRALRVEPHNTPPVVEVTIKGVVNPVNPPQRKQ